MLQEVKSMASFGLDRREQRAHGDWRQQGYYLSQEEKQYQQALCKEIFSVRVLLPEEKGPLF